MAKSARRGMRTERATHGSRSPEKLETVGLIVILILILAIVITRSWHHIPWSVR